MNVSTTSNLSFTAPSQSSQRTATTSACLNTEIVTQ